MKFTQLVFELLFFIFLLVCKLYKILYINFLYKQNVDLKINKSLVMLHVWLLTISIGILSTNNKYK